MKTKLIFAFVFVFWSSLEVSAQLKHYLSLNTVVYYDYFNKEKDEISIDESIWFFFPSLSYKIEKDKWGVEVFYNDDVKAYYFPGNYYPNGGRRINEIVRTSNIGLSCHYTILSKSYIKINPMIGLVKNWYDEEFWQLGLHSGGWWDGYVTGNRESKLGLLLGMNLNVPVYKGTYINTNFRYSRFPSAQYNKQNLMWEIGLGYIYQNKGKKK